MSAGPLKAPNRAGLAQWLGTANLSTERGIFRSDSYAPSRFLIVTREPAKLTFPTSPINSMIFLVFST